MARLLSGKCAGKTGDREAIMTATQLNQPLQICSLKSLRMIERRYLDLLEATVRLYVTCPEHIPASALEILAHYRREVDEARMGYHRLRLLQYERENL